ncbi:hypothetical protein ACVXG8_05715 [Escherichia coli]
MALSVTGACREYRGSKTDDTANAQQAEWRSWEVNKRLESRWLKALPSLSSRIPKKPASRLRARLK